VKVIEREPGMVTLLAPEFDLRMGEMDLAWAVAKPTDLTATHGINITVERLMEMAASYNPEAIEAAPINFDHAPGGPAQGWIESMEVRDSLLYVRPVELSPDVVEGIRNGRYRRASIELTTKHPETGGWYLNGLAVLGAAKPAIKGLPPLRLSAPRYVIQLGDETPSAEPEEPMTPPESPGKEKAMSENPKTEASGSNTAAEDEKKQGLWAALGELLGIGKAEPAAKPTAVVAGLSEADVQRIVAQSRVEDAVDRDLAALGGKVPPAVLGDPETRQLLLDAKGKSPERYAAALKIVAGNDASALLGGPVADAANTAAGRAGLGLNAHELAACEAAGLTAERVAVIEKKFNLNGPSN
jgi:hypothetical protein